MDIETLKTLGQFGAMGVSLACLWVLYKLVGNHLEASDVVLRELTKVLAELKQIIQDKLK